MGIVFFIERGDGLILKNSESDKLESRETEEKKRTRVCLVGIERVAMACFEKLRKWVNFSWSVPFCNKAKFSVYPIAYTKWLYST